MLPAAYLAVIIIAFLSGLTTLIGAALAIKFGRCTWGMIVGLGFAAGIMFGITTPAAVSTQLKTRTGCFWTS